MMDDKKKKLILELRKNGRKKITEIAEKHNVPASTLFDIIHKLEKEGLIKHTSLVDFQRMGYPVHVLMMLKTPLSKRTSLMNYLVMKTNVNTVFHLSPVYDVGDYDFLIEGIFSNQQEVEKFMHELRSENSILNKKIHYVIEAKKELFLTDEDHFK